MSQLEGKLQSLLQSNKARRLLVALGAVGVLLLAVPSLFPQSDPTPAAEATTDTTAAYRAELEAELARLVTAITGEPTPTVLLTLQDSGSALYAQDEQTNERETESTHVILKSQSGGQSALLVREQTPQVQGVVIVSAYAENATVREKLVSAVQAAFSLSANRICVVSGTP